MDLDGIIGYISSVEKLLGLTWIVSWFLAIWMYPVRFFLTNLRWEDHEICVGSAVLSSGPMKEGDVVTNCEGDVALRHIPFNRFFGGF